MYGVGVLKGLKLTLKKIFTKKVTEQYPDERPFIDHRWRGSFQFDINECIACNMCVNVCPNAVIEIDIEKDENNKKVVKGYDVKYERCLVCGFCVEACPKNCLRFTREFELASYHRENITLDLVNKPNLDAPSSKYAQKMDT